MSEEIHNVGDLVRPIPEEMETYGFSVDEQAYFANDRIFQVVSVNPHGNTMEVKPLSKRPGDPKTPANGFFHRRFKRV
jgi:hypothetical protein